MLKVSTVSSLGRKIVLIAAAFLFLGGLSAEARPRHAHSVRHGAPAAEPCFFFCSETEEIVRTRNKRAARVKLPEQTWSATQSQSLSQPATSSRSQDTVVGSRPAGCPSRWCGCQASIEVFGKIIPFLNRAANWLAFTHVSHASASPEMAAVRGRNHVVILKRQISATRWVVKDGNWGGKTHIRETDLSGYTVVDPHSGKLAMN
ncbi:MULTISPECIES: hypothetical protein [unclassified Bradyrhizobium]